MSKSILNTRGKILDKALEMFNERGIEYVGLRELATILNMRVSNITYYFPTKDYLVYQLSLQLRDANAAVMVADEDITLLRFLNTMRQVFQNHVRFRCLLLSIVHIMEQNKLVAHTYNETQAARSTTIKANVESLAASGYLTTKDKEDLEFLVATLALISRFWISEAAISFRKLKSEEQMRHYLLLITKLLAPYTTAKGKKDSKFFLESL